MIDGHKDLSYEERLKRCGLTNLENGEAAALIEAYKIITGKESIQSESLERFSEL